MAKPGEALLVLLGRGLAVLVLPVRRDAFFRHAMHLFGADLYFERLAVGSDHRGMQRLVEIRTRDGDEVFDAPRYRPPFVVNHSQGRVAVLDRVCNDAQREKIVHLIHTDLLPLHLLVDGIGPLHPGFHLGWNTLPAQLGFHGTANFLQQFLGAV